VISSDSVAADQVPGNAAGLAKLATFEPKPVVVRLSASVARGVDPCPSEKLGRLEGTGIASPAERGPGHSPRISLWATLGCINAHVQSSPTGPACFPFKAELKPPVAEIPLDTLRRACNLALNMFRRRSRGLSASRACVFNPNRG
jgi:hypothetical protein